MNTKLTYRISSSSVEETNQISQKIGARLKGGEVFIFWGDLGFGKTAFIKGLVAGSGIKEEVTSPSFTITNVYKGDKFTVNHMDYYRISTPGVLKDELLEIINDSSNVTVIEWPEIMLESIPESAINIKIVNDGENLRTFEVGCQQDKKYLFEDFI